MIASHSTLQLIHSRAIIIIIIISVFNLQTVIFNASNVSSSWRGHGEMRRVMIFRDGPPLTRLCPGHNMRDQNSSCDSLYSHNRGRKIIMKSTERVLIIEKYHVESSPVKT